MKKKLARLILGDRKYAEIERAEKGPGKSLGRAMQNRRILSSRVENGYRLEFHATKGHRKYAV